MLTAHPIIINTNHTRTSTCGNYRLRITGGTTDNHPTEIDNLAVIITTRGEHSQLHTFRATAPTPKETGTQEPLTTEETAQWLTQDGARALPFRFEGTPGGC